MKKQTQRGNFPKSHTAGKQPSSTPKPNNQSLVFHQEQGNSIQPQAKHMTS